MKFALIGYGKMGKTIEQIILDQNKGDEIVLKISDDNLQEFTVENLRKADVAIEFTRPDAAIANIYKCFEAGVAIVVGTTAWLDKLQEVKSICTEKNGTLFYAPNFSIGVNIFFEINKKLAAIMNRQPQYDVVLEEIHHTEKLDAPSGTAIKTAEVILGELKSKNSWKLVEENILTKDQRPKTNSNSSELSPNLELQTSNYLLITAKREPNVPGTHSVKYFSGVDEIEIIHEARSRKGFAEGAVMAARWVANKKGVFQMSDLLNF